MEIKVSLGSLLSAEVVKQAKEQWFLARINSGIIDLYKFKVFNF